MIEIVCHTDKHTILCQYRVGRSRIPIVRAEFTENRMIFEL